MIGTKRRLDDVCPLCSSKVEEHPINFDCSVKICNNPECIYPFNEFSAEELIIEIPNTTNKRYSKSSNLVSSSTVINPVALPTPVPDEKTIATPAKKARTGTYQPVSGSSIIKQKDQLHSNPFSLDTSYRVSNKENIPVSRTLTVSPVITAAKPKPIATKPASTADLITQESLMEILNIPVTAALDSKLTCDISNRPITSQNSLDDILNTPLTIDISSTPFMFDTSLFNDAESQIPTTDSTVTSPICHTSPSSSSTCTGNFNDACFSDISDAYSPPSSSEPLQTNHKKNITQNSPKQTSVILPENLALPPASAAKTVSDKNNSKYTMADINKLLNNNDPMPPTPATTNASDTNWINDFDYLFP